MSEPRKGLFGLFGKKSAAPSAGRPSRSEPTREAPLYPHASAPGESVAVYEITLEGSPLPNVVSPPDVRVEVAPTREGRRVARLSGGDPAAESSGRTGGYSIRVPDSFEAAVSGQRVRVTVVARAASGGSAEFAVAYSTAEVGNSGWRKHVVGAQFESRAFEWDVPPMINGNGDYVGILPSPSPASGVEIASVRVEVHLRA